MRRAAVIALILGTSGCYSGHSVDDGGADGDSSGDGGSAEGGTGIPSDELCDAEGPSISPLKRLSIRQYENTIRDLLRDVAPVYDEVTVLFADFPPDGDGSTFTNSDLRLSSRHINTYYAVADAVAEAVLLDDARMSVVAGDCATNATVDDGCLETFINEFGLRAYRRPLTPSEVATYAALADDPEAIGPIAYRDVLFTFLMSPQFLYHFETEGTPIDGREDLLSLDPYEIASRLSYHFWQTMPDDELFAAAADGSLGTEQGYLAQVDRVLDGPGRDQVKDTIEGFYHDWYELDAFGGFVDTPAFNTFSQGVAVDNLRDAMVEEIHALTEYYTWDQRGTFADVLLSDASVTSSPELAALYGVEPWTGEGDPPTFTAGERGGLLTRAAFLVTGDEKTGPIHRGAVVRDKILCAPLPPPDPDSLPEDALDPPPLDPSLSTRQRFEVKTAAAECQACHSLLNPIGFAQEQYDALGRFRTIERIIDDTGTEIGTVPVDPAVTVPGLVEGEPPVSGAVELMQLVVDTGDADGCFASQYFEFTFRRPGGAADQCVIENLELALSDGGAIQDLLREVALQPEFRVRAVE